MKNRFIITSLFSIICAMAFAQEPCPCLSVTGQGKVSVKATIADISLGVEVEGKTAQEVQQSLAKNVNPVLAKLKELQANRIETGTMNISPEYSNSNPPVIVKYRGSIEIHFQAEVTSAGEYIDEAIHAGANFLQSVALRPSEPVLQEARIEALKNACQSGMLEARVVLAALGLESSGIRQVNILEENFPHPVRQQKALMANFSESSTPILEQEQSVTASVSLMLDIKTGK